MPGWSVITDAPVYMRENSMDMDATPQYCAYLRPKSHTILERNIPLRESEFHDRRSLGNMLLFKFYDDPFTYATVGTLL